MKGLQTSRPVHYVDITGEHRPGSIVFISDPSRRLVNIFLLPQRIGESGGVVENVTFHRSTTEEPASRPGTWHWPERIEE